MSEPGSNTNVPESSCAVTINKMDRTVRLNLRKLLDVEYLDRRDGRILAEKLGIDKATIKLMWLGAGATINPSPTEYLFTWWEENDPTIKDLRDHLDAMRRKDVVRVIDEAKLPLQDIIRDMDNDVRSDICMLLDLESPVNGNDCRALAERLGMDNSTIQWMWRGLASVGNVRRTEYYFTCLERKGSNATIVDLRRALQEMGRHDAVEVIDQKYPELARKDKVPEQETANAGSPREIDDRRTGPDATSNVPQEGTESLHSDGVAPGGSNAGPPGISGTGLSDANHAEPLHVHGALSGASNIEPSDTSGTEWSGIDSTEPPRVDGALSGCSNGEPSDTSGTEWSGIVSTEPPRVDGALSGSSNGEPSDTSGTEWSGIDSTGPLRVDGALPGSSNGEPSGTSGTGLSGIISTGPARVDGVESSGNNNTESPGISGASSINGAGASSADGVQPEPLDLRDSSANCPSPSEASSTVNVASPNDTPDDSSGFAADLENIKAFKEEIKKNYFEQLGNYEVIVENSGSRTELVNIGAQVVSSVGGLVCGGIALGAATAATAGLVLPVVASAGLLTALGLSTYVKFRSRSGARSNLDNTTTVEMYTLKLFVEQAANELGRIFEFQLSVLRNRDEAKTMARAAVQLMLTATDRIDADELVRSVLVPSKKTSQTELETKEDFLINIKKKWKKWYAPSVFFKAGLRKTGKHLLHDQMYEFFYKESKETRASKYGFRGEFIRLDQSGDESNNERKYRDIDEKLIPVSCQGEGKCNEKKCNHISSHFLEYKPYHVLLRHYAYLKNYSQHITTQPQLAGFVCGMYDLPPNQHVKPVFRPIDPIPEKLDLTNADFNEADLTGASFKQFKLQKCDFTKCVALSVDLTGADLSGAIFQGAYLYDCSLVGAMAKGCSWSQVNVNYCQVEGADLRDPKVEVGGMTWEATDLSVAITRD